MNKIIILIVTSFLAVLIDLSLSVGVFGHFYLSILVPLVFFAAIYLDFELALVFALTAGFFSDLAFLSHSLLMTFFLTFEVLLIELVRRKVVDFINPIIFIVAIFIFGVVRALLSILLFSNGVSVSAALAIIGANLLLALTATLVWWAITFRKIKQV